MTIPLTIEMKYLNIEQGGKYNPFNMDLTKLATVIESDVASAIRITALRLPLFTRLNITSWFPSITTQLTYTRYFIPLLNSSQ